MLLSFFPSSSLVLLLHLLSLFVLVVNIAAPFAGRLCFFLIINVVAIVVVICSCCLSFIAACCLVFVAV